MAKFCFFTDPLALAAQSPTEAFGPAAAVGSKERFRVTDTHQGTTAKAYAICRGQICAQAVDGRLNLVLRPFVQPPFDFPYVEYFIYRGIRADSLLASDGKLDLGKESAGATLNNLIAYIRGKVLKHPAAQNTTESPAYLGLDRTATTATDGGDWGDGQPLDHLFRYPGAQELPIVEPGWLLGEFEATFGFEVVIQQYGAQPKIGWARNADPWIEADKVSTGASAADLYASRLQREAIGCFVDPCAFWGMFWSDGLTITGSGVKKLSALHAALFTSSPGIFANRDRAYLDIRNEVGLSYDFYGTYQDANGEGIEIGTGPLNLTAKPYEIDGWPLHYSAASSPRVCFRLRQDGASHTSLLFQLQSGGSVAKADRLKDIDPLIGSNWTKIVKFRRPRHGGVLPPWWFSAHYLRRPAGMATPVPAAGVFDTSPLQVGPIGDRVIAAYREIWVNGTASSGSTSGYQRQFVTDKVIRYDGSLKADPTDAATPRRSLSYDRVGETHYIFQKGIGPNAGKNSVIIVHRRNHKGKQKPDGTWSHSNGVFVTSAGSGLLFNALSGEILSAPVWVTLNPGAITVPSFLELRSDTPLKADLFDYTIVLLSKAAFDEAINAAAANGIPPGPGEKHPIFLSLGPASTVPSQAAAYNIGWRGWDGQNVTAAAADVPIYSADGVVFASADYDGGALATATSYAMSYEERNASPFWDDMLARDQGGIATTDRMPNLVSDFVDAILTTDATPASNPAAALLTLVEQFGKAIWDRAVAMAHDPALEEWCDLALYHARLKMLVALKNHPFLLQNPADSDALAAKFEAHSRNFTRLDFSNSISGDALIILTGFDPYEINPKNGTKLSNPSGRLALLLSEKKYKPPGANQDRLISTCTFPNRWDDFDELLVEDVIRDTVTAANNAGLTISLLCTTSCNPMIKSLIVGMWYPTDQLPAPDNYSAGTGDMKDLMLYIDRYAVNIREGPDNNNVTVTLKMPPHLPSYTQNFMYYDTRLKIMYTPTFTQTSTTVDLSVYDLNRPIIIRYNAQYDTAPPAFASVSDILDHFRQSIETKADTTIGLVKFGQNTAAYKGSGGNFLSNALFYRTSNLLQSTSWTAQSLPNGHLHIPNLGKYYPINPDGSEAATEIGEAKLVDLAKSVMTVIDGVLGP